MSNKHKITFSLSFVLALLFALPWFTVVEQIRVSGLGSNDSSVSPRVIFIFTTVFATSCILFSYNFFWKHKLVHPKSKHQWLVNVLSNLLLVIMLTIAVELLAILLFDIKAVRAYFIFYFFRNFIIATVVVLVAYAVGLIDELRQEKIEVLLLQKQNTETELAALRSQIDPHFLFNTLTTLSSLVRNNSKESISFIDHMADTFRYMLDNRAEKVVPITDELSFLRSYVFMMQKRFGGVLQVEFDLRTEHLVRSVPQFALQAAVENAIKHNVISLNHPLQINIQFCGDSVIVRNNINAKKSSQGYGIGLDNLAQRYWLMAKKKIRVTKTIDFFEIEMPLL